MPDSATKIIRDRLLASADVTAIVGGGATSRIYQVRMPETTVFPAIRMQQVSSLPEFVLEGGLPIWTEITIAALAGTSGPTVLLDSERSLFESDSAAEIFHIAQDYTLYTSNPD